MPFRLVPEGITMYPGQQQTFAVTNEPAPVIWGTAGLTLDTDRTINGYTDNSAVVLAVGRSGICRIKWTFTSLMIPASGNTVDLRMSALTTTSTALFNAQVGPSLITIKNNAGSTLTTVSHSVAAGDYFILEKAGNAFRLYINSDTAASYTYTYTSEPLKYPSYCQIVWGTLTAGTASRISIPELIGDWGIVDGFSNNTGNWTCTNGSTAGGTFVDASDILKVDFTAGSVPGAYTMSCVIGGVAVQTATSVVTIAPLTIVGVESSIIMQPGEERRIDTNYDQNGLKTTWSVVSGGGSFTNGTYTAATTPGTSVLRSTYGNQAAEITVTVPVTITSSVGISTATEDRLRVQAAILGEAITFTTNMTGSITWTADYGTSSGSGSSFVWTAPSTSQIVARVTATNGTYTKTVEVPVLKAIPQDAMATIDGEQKRTVVVSRAEDRSRYGRIKDRNQQSYKAWTLNFRNQSASEFDTMGAFHDEHFPSKRVIFYDKARGTTIRRVVYIDSDISYRISSNCGYEYSFRIIEG